MSKPTTIESSKKNWLFVLPTDSLQGSEHIVKTMCTYINDSKLGSCNVIILSKKSSNGWQDLESVMKIKYFPFKKYFLGILFLLPYLALNKKNIIDYTFSSQTLINGTLGLAKKIRLLRKETHVILRESNSIFKLLKGFKLRVYSLFYRLGYSNASLIICQTDLMKSQLVEALPKMRKKLNIKTIPNPFDFNGINKNFGELPPFIKNKEFIVAAGRLAPVKGFDLLIKAFSKINKEFSDLHLIILGEGSERENLETLVKSLNIENCVYLPGYVNNVYKYFNKAQLCVISSHLEGFPNVLLQMMSQNERVVSTTSAGDIANISGLKLCAPGNQTELEQAITSSLKEVHTDRRDLFDTYLKKRTKENFYKTMMLFIE